MSDDDSDGLSDQEHGGGRVHDDDVDYLWDREGAPDPELARLEQALGALRYQGELPPLPARAPVSGATPSRPASVAGPGSGPAWFLAAAAVLLCAGLATWAALRPDGAGEAPVAHGAPRSDVVWRVARLDEVARCGGAPLGADGALRVGEWLETAADGRARLEVARIGEVEVGPRSRLRLSASGPDEHRLELAVGRLEATVTAPPRLFVVDTPSAAAVDLGCAYTLEVDPQGAGTLDVRVGFVALERDGREAIVPAHARCLTRPGVGPGTPFFADAPAALVTALEALDFASADPDAARKHLAEVLCAARPRDGLTLWHLLPRTSGSERDLVYERLALLSPPPAEVTKEAVLALEPAALDAWREAMDWSFF